jgi:hypothetical protein
MGKLDELHDLGMKFRAYQRLTGRKKGRLDVLADKWGIHRDWFGMSDMSHIGQFFSIGHDLVETMRTASIAMT